MDLKRTGAIGVVDTTLFHKPDHPECHALISTGVSTQNRPYPSVSSTGIVPSGATKEELIMKPRLFLAAVFSIACALPAFAADDSSKPNAGTGKGAAVGAAAGHEVGSGHAVAGAATGAAVGHHEEKKAEEKK